MTLRRRVRSSRGAELVELALVIPILLMLVGGIVDFGLMFQAFSVINNAAREGARVRVLPGYTTTDAQNRVAAYVSAAGLSGTPSTVVTPVTISAGGAGAPSSAGFQVQVQYTYTFTMLRAILSNITLTSRSVMRSET